MAVTKLRRIRKERGFSSMERVATVLGMTTQAVYYWENGISTPRRAAGLRLEALMQTPLTELLEIETTATRTAVSGSPKPTIAKGSRCV